MNNDRNNDRNDCQLISRRVALAGTALALGAAAAVQAAARQKINQADAKYQSSEGRPAL